MIPNFYFVMIVIGKKESLHQNVPMSFTYILVVIICIVVLHRYQKHRKVIGVVNYVVLNLVNFHLDLLLVYYCRFFFLNNYIWMFNSSNVVCQSQCQIWIFVSSRLSVCFTHYSFVFFLFYSCCKNKKLLHILHTYLFFASIYSLIDDFQINMTIRYLHQNLSSSLFIRKKFLLCCLLNSIIHRIFVF